MRTLGKLKLLTASALLMIGMSSCLKSSDPGFQFGVMQPYMMQKGHGDNATFAPAIRIYAYEPILKAVAEYKGETYSFSAANTDKTVMDMSLGYIYTADSIPNGVYTISASNVQGETASLPLTFDIDKRLGELKVTSFTYKASEGIKASWEKTDNASAYYLLVRSGDDRFWQIYNWAEGALPELTSGTFRANWEKGTEIEVAVAAGYRLLFTAGPTEHITWGTDSVTVPEE